MAVRVESNTQLTPEQERVYRLRNALERDGGTPGGFLELLAAVVTEGTWKQVPSGVNNDQPFTSFKDFIEAKPPFGLGHNAQDVFTLLKIRHPHEVAADFRSRMEAARAEIVRLLALDGISDYTDEQRFRDIKAWGALDQSGGWWLGFFVACHVQPGDAESDDKSQDAKMVPTRAAGLPKISARHFADLAGTSTTRVMRYYAAWQAAWHAGAVPASADDLFPGHEPIALPAAEEWGNFYSSRRSATSERGLLISAAAEAEGIRPTKALEVAENPTALRAAILADTRTAETARAALMDRMNEDTELQSVIVRTLASQPALKRAISTESRRADHVEFVRKVAHLGSAKTPAGHFIDLPDEIRIQAYAHLGAAEVPEADAEAVEAAYSAVQALIVEAVEMDPELQVQERRSTLQKTLSATVKSIETIDADSLIAVADDELRGAIAALQARVNDLAHRIAQAS